ncbi:hypothetical protein Fmac_031870 [Flemingia macrophylla]|uniref:MADS-box domain-containing protein n=1 Tax=Flemingia macrophylla TaxID=520843 RepID=A0ABD1L3A6_9FABA
MPRKKVKLAFIVNKTQRKAAYKTRVKSVLRMTKELCTLCGIQACAIVFSPFVPNPDPEIWPSNLGVLNVLGRFVTMPEWNRRRNMMNQESFTYQKILKCRENIKKLEKENKEDEMTMLMLQSLNPPGFLPNNINVHAADDLNVLSKVIEKNLQSISKRLETLNVDDMPQYQQPYMQAPACQPQMQTPEQMMHLNYGHGLDTSVNSMIITEEITQLNHENGLDNNVNLMHTREEMAQVNYTHGLDMSLDDFMQMQWDTNLFNDNVDDTILPPFGDTNFQF